MEILVTAISLALLFGLLIIPPVLLHSLKRRKINFKYILYFTMGTFLTALLILLFAWWSHKSDEILLAHYGYNSDGLNDKEFYKNVAPQNVQRVRSLVISMSGIGWPVGAIIAYVFYLPYLILVAIVFYLIERGKRTVFRK